MRDAIDGMTMRRRAWRRQVSRIISYIVLNVRNNHRYKIDTSDFFTFLCCVAVESTIETAGALCPHGNWKHLTLRIVSLALLATLHCPTSGTMQVDESLALSESQFLSFFLFFPK